MTPTPVRRGTDRYPHQENQRPDRALQSKQERPSLQTRSAQDGWSSPQYAQLPQEKRHQPLSCNHRKAWPEKVISFCVKRAEVSRRNPRYFRLLSISTTQTVYGLVGRTVFSIKSSAAAGCRRRWIFAKIVISRLPAPQMYDRQRRLRQMFENFRVFETELAGKKDQL